MGHHGGHTSRLNLSVEEAQQGDVIGVCNYFYFFCSYVLPWPGTKDIFAEGYRNWCRECKSRLSNYSQFAVESWELFSQVFNTNWVVEDVLKTRRNADFLPKRSGLSNYYCVCVTWFQETPIFANWFRCFFFCWKASTSLIKLGT